MKRSEFLQRVSFAWPSAHASESQHCPARFSPCPRHGYAASPSAERQVRVFRPIVQPAARFLTIQIAQCPHRSRVGSQPVGDDGLGATMPLQRLLQKPQSHRFVPFFGDVGLQYFAFMVDSAPQVPRRRMIRSNSRSSTLRSDSGNRTYSITTSRITSGEEWNYRNGLTGFQGRDMPVPYPPRYRHIATGCSCIDRAGRCTLAHCGTECLLPRGSWLW